jgi:hypothetical protein
MALGASFPPAFLEAQIRRRLVPGAVIKLRQQMDDGNVHEKRFVVIQVDEATTTCVINSQISAFLVQNPSMLRCQVSMPAASHTFMSHDSHVDCSRARSYRTETVIRDLVAQPDWVLGSITLDLRDSMIAALKFAPTLSAKQAKQYCESLASLV